MPKKVKLLELICHNFYLLTNINNLLWWKWFWDKYLDLLWSFNRISLQTLWILVWLYEHIERPSPGAGDGTDGPSGGIRRPQNHSLSLPAVQQTGDYLHPGQAARGRTAR